MKLFFYVPSSRNVIFAAIAMIGMVFSSRDAFTLVSFVSVFLFAMLLWRKGEPPVLLYCVLFQWISVVALSYFAGCVNAPLSDFTDASKIREAAWLSLIGLFALTAGIRLALWEYRAVNIQRCHGELVFFSTKRLFIAYLAAFLVSCGLRVVLWVLPGFSQIFKSLFSLKWIMFYLLVCTVIRKKQSWHYLILATALEVVIGFTGFFSEFKQVFFVLLIAFFTMKHKLSVRNLLPAACVLGFVLYLCITWTSLKEEYRNYLNEGTRQQVINVPLGARLEKLYQLYTEKNDTEVREVVENFVMRVAYIEMFAYVMETVPLSRPYENGKLWMGAIRHVLFPRLFWPDKPVLPSDSELTMEYTGLKLASGEEGTSISMGYMAESYIDFGVPGMFLPILGLGLLYGLIYKYFNSKAAVKVFGYAFSVGVLINANQLEMHSVKLVGGMLASFIVMALTLKLASKSLYSYLSQAR